MPATKSLKKGDVLFNEGDRSMAMYFVQSGTLRLYKKKGAGSIELGTVHTGEVIGEMGFLDGGPRSASAEAILGTELVEITGTNMAEQTKCLPPWLMVLLKTVVNRLRSANNKIRQLESAGSTLDYSGDGPTTRQYEFLSVHDVLKVCTAALLVGTRNGEQTTNAVKCQMSRILRYANQIMSVPLSKVTEMLDILERVGLAKIDRAVADKPDVYLLDLDQLEILVAFINEDNLKDDAKRFKFSIKAVVIMGYIVKHLALFPPDANGICEVNLARIMAAEKQASGKDPFRVDEFAELARAKIATEAAMRDAENIITKVKGKDIARMFKIQKALKEIEIVNEKKRGIVRRTAPAGETPQGLGRKDPEMEQVGASAPASAGSSPTPPRAAGPAAEPQIAAKALGK